MFVFVVFQIMNELEPSVGWSAELRNYCAELGETEFRIHTPGPGIKWHFFFILIIEN